MTDRISSALAPMQEYGRKPYLVTKETVPLGEEADYRYMMDKTWHKAQDNKYIVVQSVKKKPYNEQDYQMMENSGDFPIFTIPRWNFNFDFPFDVTRASIKKATTETEVTGLRWLQCPTTVSASKTYTIIVRNSSITTRSLIGGRINSTTKQYLPTAFTLTKATSDAKGMVIYDLIDKGSTTWITLGVASYADGNYYLEATDGKNKIDRKLLISSSKESTIVLKRNTSPATYYKIGDLIMGDEIPYTVFTVKPNVFLSFTLGYTITSITTDDYGSYEVQSYLQNMYLSDGGDTHITSCIYIDGDYGSYRKTYGEEANTGLWTPPYKEEISFIEYTSYPSTNITVRRNRTTYVKYPSISMLTITDDYSAVQTGAYGENLSLNTTGTLHEWVWFIDSTSYVMEGKRFSTTSAYPCVSYYHFSGQFSGSYFSFNVSWLPGFIYFGSL